MRVSVILPCYNCGRVDEVVRELKNLNIANEIIVVDDGSTDDITRKSIKNIQDIPAVKVITHGKNCGKGCAMRTGVEHSQGDVVIFMDADGQHLPSEVITLLSKIPDCDVVIGNRSIIKEGKRPIHRKLSNYLTTKLVQLLYGVKINDSQSGFRAFRRECLPDIENDRYGADTELLLKSIKLGCKICEVPVSRIYGDFESHFNFKDIIDFIRILWKYKNWNKP